MDDSTCKHLYSTKSKWNTKNRNYQTPPNCVNQLLKTPDTPTAEFNALKAQTSTISSKTEKSIKNMQKYTKQVQAEKSKNKQKENQNTH